MEREVSPAVRLDEPESNTSAPTPRHHALLDSYITFAGRRSSENDSNQAARNEIFPLDFKLLERDGQSKRVILSVRKLHRNARIVFDFVGIVCDERVMELFSRHYQSFLDKGLVSFFDIGSGILSLLLGGLRIVQNATTFLIRELQIC